jgi:hypothetical protein
MLRYYLASSLFKLFSLNAATRSAYRAVGNGKNAVKGANAPIGEHYVERGRTFLGLLREHDVLRPGLKTLEIGTGWVHWESLMCRNAIECDTTLYDVWDNRSLTRFRSYARQLADPALRQSIGLPEETQPLMTSVADAGSFDEAYELLGFNYLTDETGLLRGIPDRSVDLAYASDVGEHLRREDIPEILTRSLAILKPGGFLYHQIVMSDHLKLYAPDVHWKQYLAFSAEEWDRRINSGIQYINRVQIPDWKRYFDDAGFQLVDERRLHHCELANIDVHADYQDVPEEDLRCNVVQFLLRRPLDS